MSMTSSDVTTIGTELISIIGAITIAAVAIIRAINENRRVTVAGQDAGTAWDKVRDKKIQEIHILTNSRLTAALNLIMAMAKKEYERTNSIEDRALFEASARAVTDAEIATSRVLIRDENDPDLIAAHLADAKLATVTQNLH